MSTTFNPNEKEMDRLDKEAREQRAASETVGALGMSAKKRKERLRLAVIQDARERGEALRKFAAIGSSAAIPAEVAAYYAEAGATFALQFLEASGICPFPLSNQSGASSETAQQNKQSGRQLPKKRQQKQ